MNRTDRLYALVEELRAVAPRPRSARWLAARFEVSTRTVERDLAALQQAGVPIHARTGRAGGYVLDPGRTLPPLALTPTEATALAAGLHSLGGSPFADAARSAVQKILAVLPASERSAAADLAARVRMIAPDSRPAASRPGPAAPAGSAAPGPAARGSAAPGSAARGPAAPGSAAPGSAAPGSVAAAPGSGASSSEVPGSGSGLAAAGAGPVAARPGLVAPGHGSRVHDVVRAALAGRRVLRLAYTDRDGTTSERDVEPIGFLGGDRWYLIGWCRLRDGVRGFRLDRIATAETLPETAPPRPVDLSEVDALGHDLVGLDVIANTDRTVSRRA